MNYRKLSPSRAMKKPYPITINQQSSLSISINSPHDSPQVITPTSIQLESLADPSKTVLKIPYKIPTTEERKQSPTRPFSPHNNHHHRNHRIISVKKFHAHTSILSPEKQSFYHEKFTSSKSNPNLNPNIITENLDTSSSINLPRSPLPSPSPAATTSHITIKSSNDLHTRWPQKVLQKKDIEKKPWYLLSFEETVELYCGDEIREEIYPKYNKSFVTKLKKTSPNKKGKISSSMDQAVKQKANLSSSFSKKRNLKGSNNSTVNNSSTSNLINSPVNTTTSTENKIRQAIRFKKLKTIELQKEIAITNAKIAKLQMISQQEHSKIQQLISSTELSNQNIQYLKLKITFLLNKTKLSIQELLNHNSDNQSYLNKLQQEVRDWEKDYFFKFNRHNLSVIEKKLQYEKFKLHLKFKIRCILIMFSELMKKHRYTTNWLYQSSFSATNYSKSRSPSKAALAQGSQIQLDQTAAVNQRNSITPAIPNPPPISSSVLPPPPPTDPNNSTKNANRSSVTFSKSLQKKMNNQKPSV